MANIESERNPEINTAQEKELFESLFADAGSRESIGIREWTLGWSAIVGGVNGIPTSRQFNTLQYITDLKCFLLYQAVVTLKEAGTKGIVIGPPQKLGNNMILFETMKDSNRIVKVRQTDSKGNEYEYDIAAVFKMAEKRENIQSGDSLSIIFGKIMKFLSDLKSNCFNDADDPFVLMTETTYKPPSERTKGCAYGLITNKRGLIIKSFDRYVTGLEDPAVEKTLYGVEKTERTNLEMDSSPYKAIFSNVVYIKEGQEIVREPGKIYATIKETR